MKKFGLFLLVATIGLFAACSSDKKYEEEVVDPKTDYAKEIEGTYKGMLDIAVPNDDPLSTEDIVTLTRTKEDVVTLELNDFSFGDIPVGDIVIEDVIVAKKGDNIVLKEKTAKIKLSETLGGIEVPVTVSGKFVNGKLNLEISITDVFPEAIKVTFVGTKTDSVVDYAKELAGTYKGALNIILPNEDPISAEDLVILKRTGHNLVKLELNDFSFGGIPVGDIVIEDVVVDKEGENIVLKEKSSKIKLEKLGGIEATVTVIGTSTEGKLNLDLSITDVFPEAIKVAFVGDKLKGSENAEAKILSIAFDHEAVLLQPTVEANKTTITLYVKDDTDIKTLTEVPVTITISEKATVLPASGSKVDFSEGSAKFVVLAENGTKVTYTVNVSYSLTFFDMEEWVVESGDLGIDLFAPSGGWATSNIGAAFLQGITGVYTNVDKVEDAHGGKYAAKLTTLDTKGKNMWVMYAPKVTPASLFTGTFDLGPAMSGNTLAATKFGVPFNKKPLILKGYYKYTAGEVYFECPDPKKHHIANENKNKVDQGSVNAILYEIVDNNDPYLTGVDAYTSDKLVARAEFNSGDQATYKEFSAEFKPVNGKTYDAKKKYRIAIIASSSKDGDKFSGAPGSTLFLDDIQIISE